MTRPLPLLGQIVTYAVFAVLIGVFANGPAYAPSPPDQAQIVLDFIHGGKPDGDCRDRTPEEMAKLAPNMRRAKVCPRRRVPLLVELEVDGKLLYRDSLPPSGLTGDFPSHVHRRFVIAPGPHRLTVRLRDSRRTEGFDHEKSTEMTLTPGQSFAIDFRSAANGFVFH
ncbi:MAG: hypothetical protein FJX42_06390 [Alphaproteobacteria bacterium]|nr:hypothetical protein [Alphaproteobacteria bacterium]